MSVKTLARKSVDPNDVRYEVNVVLRRLFYKYQPVLHTTFDTDNDVSFSVRVDVDYNRTCCARIKLYYYNSNGDTLAQSRISVRFDQWEYEQNALKFWAVFDIDLALALHRDIVTKYVKHLYDVTECGIERRAKHATIVEQLVLYSALDIPMP